MSSKKQPARVLTGIKPTGVPHLGNYIGAIRPAIGESLRDDRETFYFLADYHALVSCRDPEKIQDWTHTIAATWLALGLDVERAVFYRQSDIPEIPALTWLLSCVTAKGLMNRAHAYKAAVQDNLQAGADEPDRGVNMGLYTYPILMAADILMFNPHAVPVGKDQVQHIEMARDIAGCFNHAFGKHFVLPEALVDENTAVLRGLDGRKMSKSYGNTIPLFCSEKKLRQHVMKIVTNSLEPGEPKDPDSCTLFQIFLAFVEDEAERAAKRQQYEQGAAWGLLKQELFEILNASLSAPRAEYERLMADPGFMESVLRKGAERAREHATPFLEQLHQAVGLRALV